MAWWHCQALLRLEKQPHTPHISRGSLSHRSGGWGSSRGQRAQPQAAGDGPSPPLDCLVCWVPRLSRCEGRPPNKERLSSLCQVAWSFCSLTAFHSFIAPRLPVSCLSASVCLSVCSSGCLLAFAISASVCQSAHPSRAQTHAPICARSSHLSYSLSAARSSSHTRRAPQYLPPPPPALSVFMSLSIVVLSK